MTVTLQQIASTGLGLGAGQPQQGLDDGEVVHLKAGDVVVQRGTVHNWINNGTEDCVMAYVLIAASLPEGLEGVG